MIFHDVSVADLVITSSEILPIVNEFEVFELDTLLSDVYCPVSLTLNCFSSSKRVSSFSGADN